MLYACPLWGRGGQENYVILPLFETWTTSLYLHTERFSLGKEEGIRKFYFDCKSLKNNEAHIHVEIQVKKKLFKRALFEPHNGRLIE